MGQIRPFFEKDIPQVADLYTKVFLGSKNPSSQALQNQFHTFFFQNPWVDDALPCLVFEDNRGTLKGFLGVMPRRMRLKGQPIKVAVSNNYMIDPDSRNTLAGVQLLKKFFQGPQDLSISEGGDPSRKIWEALGGTTALLYSIQWLRILRPSQYITSVLMKDKSLARLATAGRPICRLVDSVLARVQPNRFHQMQPQPSEQEISVEKLHTCISGLADGHILYPEYDIDSLSWLLNILSKKKNYGALRKVMVCNAGDKIIGWYLYYLRPGGVSEVIQIGADHNSINAVLDHLIYYAWQQGAIALSGKIEPRFMKEFSGKYCLFKHGGPWMMVHSKDPEVLNAIYRGDAFFSRVEGEWMFYNFWDCHAI
jgi:hypothetical protein